MTPALSSGGARLVPVGIIEKTQEVVHQCSARYSQGSRQRASSRVCSRRASWRRRRGRDPPAPPKNNGTRRKKAFVGRGPRTKRRHPTSKRGKGARRSFLS